MKSSLDLLAEFMLDVWLAARFVSKLCGLSPDGRAWERTVAALLYRPGFTRRQGPGNRSLFGSLSASGVRHEIDGAADGWRGSFMVECNAAAGGISKGDAALFHFKLMDFYQKNVTLASTQKWWRIICGTTPTHFAARAAAISLGLLVCDPSRLPLPVLFRAARRPAADMHLPEPQLQEILRLGERALIPQQERWRYRLDAHEISFRPDHWKDSEIRDLLWLEDKLSASLLNFYETRRPGALEQRAMKLIMRSRKAAA